jgi:selenocysteine-specific elongation factor
VTTPPLLAVAEAAVRATVEGAGPEGVDVATFDERERAVLGTLDDVVIAGGIARPAGASDAATRLALDSLRAGGFSPPAPDSVPRHEIRLLINDGLVVERNGIAFHVDAVVAAGELAARLLETSEGFTVSEFRAAAETTRKFALPLLAELDARGVTRRRGDVRIAGPRLPPARP